MERLHLEPGDDRFRLRYLGWNDGRRFTPECPAVSYGNNTRVALDLKLTNGNRHGDYQSGGEWMTRHLPAVSWGIFDAAGFEKATTYFPFDDPVAEGFAYSARHNRGPCGSDRRAG